MKFSKESYKNLLETIVAKGFVFSTDLNIITKELLLRHDIDFDLVLAHQMALIENSLGIKSLYLVMTQNPLYDVSSKESVEHIEKINSLGHEIGLHYDPSVSYIHNFSDQFCKLNSLLGFEAKFYSHHQPTLYGFSNIEDTGNRISLNAHFSNFEYISDSCMQPRKDFFEVINGRNKVHLLIHPEFWMLDSINLYDFGSKLKKIKRNSTNAKIDEIISVMISTLADRENLDARNIKL